MRNWILIAAVMTMLIGCSKDGKKSHLMEGGTMQDLPAEPTPTDMNFPELGQTTPNN